MLVGHRRPDNTPVDPAKTLVSMNPLRHRITSPERWGMRSHAAFQADTVAYVREAGYTGMLINGGAGIGPDMLPIESPVENRTIPDPLPVFIMPSRPEIVE